MIRPEQVKLSADGAAGQSQQARVLHSHYLGSATRVVLDINGERLTMQERLPFGRHPKSGDVLDVTITTDSLRVIPMNEGHAS
ncbi:TOBE domain-containing protein [Bradyrhizobium sp. LB14.3]|uniref:TOBE domain-containing protein n=1 Tax=Bradyrhizobium sp. LB14.3 TaxID=3156328 RepID=UPI003399411D